ncbi:DnaJ C-terminal domain-containing protein [Streptomyces sp. DSM 44917]|uniref:DnaJ C-terminal domain-containing protein n=1 Tax=Streptomyces boetiae TaxID=3075541 RepID=A0ABU2LDD2_9ACTN|nr:DnaJ C-terminal domain-containing protein [Streptomyces sp. DSM 44917]MDT0309588.1 DnaJ C-terminal domain-containing protein [Streptomyces sp. DSM 44917]
MNGSSAGGCRREALLIATGTYDSPALDALRSPAQDAEGLAAVLGDPEIGAFGVQRLTDARSYEVARALERFFRGRSRDDLLLLHLSCHGIKDHDGRLYFAARDTDKDLPASTAVPASFLHDLMDRCRARSIVVLLDCCYSGAFLRGSRGDRDVHLHDELAGAGRAILTATSRTEYAWEGPDLRSVSPGPSRFTGALIHGLRTGEADTDGDGRITVTELYDYVYETLLRTPGVRQTPHLWAQLEYRVTLARARPRTPRTAAPTPPPDGPPSTGGGGVREVLGEFVVRPRPEGGKPGVAPADAAGPGRGGKSPLSEFFDGLFAPREKEPRQSSHAFDLGDLQEPGAAQPIPAQGPADVLPPGDASGSRTEGAGPQEPFDLSQLFADGQRASTRPEARPGRGISLRLECELAETVLGATKQVTVELPAPCATCDGTGEAPGGPVTCGRCGGDGRNRRSGAKRDPVCPDCLGSGENVPAPCAACDGMGRAPRQRTLTLRVPAGVRSGTRLRYGGQGEAGEGGGPPGDLFVEIVELPHPELKRDGDENLEVFRAISPQLARDGGKITVPTLNGTRTVRIAPGTPLGRVLRLPGEGAVRRDKSGRGDLLVRLTGGRAEHTRPKRPPTG